MNDYAARDALAAKLNGREYGSEITKAEAQEAAKAGLLVVFGASDDLTEFRGIIDDEAGAYNGDEHKIIREDGEWSIAQDDCQCERCTARLKKMPSVIINAEWCPEGFDGSWRITAPVPSAQFSVMEDGELFCAGVVIAEADLLPPFTA